MEKTEKRFGLLKDLIDNNQDNLIIKEIGRWVSSLFHTIDSNNETIAKLVFKYHEYTELQTKEIEFGKKYFVCEWSWNPICDGRFVYEEIIREHAVIDGIDCYFTNKNNRVYFKEDIHETEEEAEKTCDWQCSFGYDYETMISKQNRVLKLITFDNYHWRYRQKEDM